MGVKISGAYFGGLATSMTHDLSGVSVVTDPPLDNGGEGKSFSPTDLVATAVGSCMMSVMAIYAKKEHLDLTGMLCSVEKHMSADLPRRISRLDVVLNMPKGLAKDQRECLEKIGNACPVIQSIHPSMELNKSYIYNI
jgi:putative redox protein